MCVKATKHQLFLVLGAAPAPGPVRVENPAGASLLHRPFSHLLFLPAPRALLISQPCPCSRRHLALGEPPWSPPKASPTRCRSEIAPAPGAARGGGLRSPGWAALCGRGEGEPCGAEGRCAAGLECLPSTAAAPLGVCVCKSRYPVCGSDGLTYGSGCQLRAARLTAPRELGAERLFSLVAGPSIVTPPKDIWNVTGAQIYLSCEVIGIPTPVLTWNKVGLYGVQRMELLPGDRENLAIQTRGGPEKHEVTGWVLISPLSKEDAGEYECHASNAKGEATASAKIHVVETLHQGALGKGRRSHPHFPAELLFYQ
uniref:Insulin like growth factor binding protein 7 n=1 Tax=Nothoprocta perdicaria TaxID=30464 RepID=A0A8C7A4I6_NOTPE